LATNNLFLSRDYLESIDHVSSKKIYSVILLTFLNDELVGIAVSQYIT
jgi:hypothetical protein